jgi:hypothetical protein
MRERTTSPVCEIGLCYRVVIERTLRVATSPVPGEDVPR